MGIVQNRYFILEINPLLFPVKHMTVQTSVDRYFITVLKAEEQNSVSFNRHFSIQLKNLNRSA